VIDSIEKFINVEVRTFFQPELSDPSVNEFVYAYRVIITNKSKSTIQLLSRHWFINDGNGRIRQVVGDGVVGEQPILEPGEKFQYTSSSSVETDCGNMHGNYTFLDLNSRKQFNVKIPKFNLVTPCKSN
jgi:ApaG protein